MGAENSEENKIKPEKTRVLLPQMMMRTHEPYNQCLSQPLLQPLHLNQTHGISDYTNRNPTKNPKISITRLLIRRGVAVFHG